MRWLVVGLVALLAGLSQSAEAAVTDCKATAAAPTVVEGRLSPLSCNLSGELRTTGSGGGGGASGDVNIDEVGGIPVGVSGVTVDLGTNNDVVVTSLPATPAGTNNIGDVDVLTVPADPFGANADAASLTTSISAKLRAIATALGSTALDLGSGTSGSRTLRVFQDTAQFVGGTGVDSTAVRRVSLATNVALPAGTNNIGDVDVLTLPATPTGNNNIGDVDVATIAAGNNNIGDVDVASQTGAGATASAVPATATYIGGAADGGLAAGTPALKGIITCDSQAVVSTAAANNTEIVALTASERIYVCGYMLVGAAAVDVQWVYGTGSACGTSETDLTGVMAIAAAGGGMADSSPFWRGFGPPVSNALCLELSGAFQVSGWVSYTKF